MRVQRGAMGNADALPCGGGGPMQYVAKCGYTAWHYVSAREGAFIPSAPARIPVRPSVRLQNPPPYHPDCVPV